jgi:tRNA-specific 2-thiouridylase
LGVKLNCPVFVAEIHLEDNEIVLAKYDELYRSKLILSDFYFVDNE